MIIGQPACRTCKHFVVGQNPAEPGIGECHRYPPTSQFILGNPKAVENGHQPQFHRVINIQTVPESHLCGEYTVKIAALS